VLGITAIVVQSFALLEVLTIAILLGIRILRPKVVGSALPVTKAYVKSYCSPIREMASFPMLYVVEIGYYVNNDPTKPILGVYAAEHIKDG